MNQFSIRNFLPKSCYPLEGIITLNSDDKEIEVTGKFKIEYADIIDVLSEFDLNKIRVYDFEIKPKEDRDERSNKSSILFSISSSQTPKSWHFSLLSLISVSKGISMPPQNFFPSENDFVACKEMKEFLYDISDFSPVSISGICSVDPNICFSFDGVDNSLDLYLLFSLNSDGAIVTISTI